MCVLLLAAAYVIGPPAAGWIVALVGFVMLVGRYWWPADIFRQMVWRVLEPAGIVRRRDVHEDHSTRRVARALGGSVLVLAAGVVGLGQSWAWIAVALLAAMIFLDAAFDF